MSQPMNESSTQHLNRAAELVRIVEKCTAATEDDRQRMRFHLDKANAHTAIAQAMITEEAATTITEALYGMSGS